MDQGDIVKHFAGRKLIVQMKRFLDTLSDLRADHDAQMHRLVLALSQIESKLEGELEARPCLVEHALQSSWLDDEKMGRLRKRVIDCANDLRREIESELDRYNISLK